MVKIGESGINTGLLTTNKIKSKRNESLENIKVSVEKLKYYTNEDPSLKNLKSKINQSKNIKNDMDEKYLKYHMKRQQNPNWNDSVLVKPERDKLLNRNKSILREKA